MKKVKLLDAIILFASLGFFAMFVDQVLYKKNPFSDSYFFLMFGIAGILAFLYRRGNQILKDNENKGKKK
jgi:hypothetical protein